MIKPRKIPYAGTQKDPETTIAEIGKLLRSFGIEDYQTTTLWSKEDVELKFSVETKDGRHVGIRLIPPALKVKKRVYDEKLARTVVKEIPSWPQSLRLLMWYLKAKLEAVAYGVKTFNEEFLSDTIVRTAEGERTVGEIVIPALVAHDYAMPALGIGGRDTIEENEP